MKKKENKYYLYLSIFILLNFFFLIFFVENSFAIDDDNEDVVLYSQTKINSEKIYTNVFYYLYKFPYIKIIMELSKIQNDEIIFENNLNNEIIYFLELKDRCSKINKNCFIKDINNDEFRFSKSFFEEILVKEKDFLLNVFEEENKEINKEEELISFNLKKYKYDFKIDENIGTNIDKIKLGCIDSKLYFYDNNSIFDDESSEYYIKNQCFFQTQKYSPIFFEKYNLDLIFLKNLTNNKNEKNDKISFINYYIVNNSPIIFLKYKVNDLDISKIQVKSLSSNFKEIIQNSQVKNYSLFLEDGFYDDLDSNSKNISFYFSKDNRKTIKLISNYDNLNFSELYYNKENNEILIPIIYNDVIKRELLNLEIVFYDLDENPYVFTNSIYSDDIFKLNPIYNISIIELNINNDFNNELSIEDISMKLELNLYDNENIDMKNIFPEKTKSFSLFIINKRDDGLNNFNEVFFYKKFKTFSKEDDDKIYVIDDFRNEISGRINYICRDNIDNELNNEKSNSYLDFLMLDSDIVDYYNINQYNLKDFYEIFDNMGLIYKYGNDGKIDDICDKMK
ncbi:MAG: hypothetical protein PHT94_02220 [Candidatus Nanoarchaeia archaeon]|nr:hypothetical protein [Candidatus Nanoarchaeia archaeon]